MDEKKIKSAKKIREEIVRKYNKNPVGWGVLVGMDCENYLNSLFFHENDFWVIKEFALNPYKFVGFGTKSELGDRDDEIIPDENLWSFGLRPLKPEEEKAILSGTFSSLLSKFLKRKPVSSEECSRDSVVMEGPVLFSRKIFISKEQKRLDKEMRASMRKLIYRKHPELMKGYVYSLNISFSFSLIYSYSLFFIYICN